MLAVTFALHPDRMSQPLRYAELARALGLEPGARAPLHEVREAVLALRRGKGMVLDPADPDTVSAGSFFMNPILDPDALAALEPSPPAFPQPDGRVKTSAAWLIERAGFGKGYTRGRVAISSKHALALVNRGGRPRPSCWRWRARSPRACASASASSCAPSRRSSARPGELVRARLAGRAHLGLEGGVELLRRRRRVGERAGALGP